MLTVSGMAFLDREPEGGCSETEGTFNGVIKITGEVFGDVWTFVPIDADTKLVPSWLVGQRNADEAALFLADLRSRLDNRVQLTTDGHRMYLAAVAETLSADVDYAMLVKQCGATPDDATTRYSPAPCIGMEVKKITGVPDPDHISSSHLERPNLTMRVGCGGSLG